MLASLRWIVSFIGLQEKEDKTWADMTMDVRERRVFDTELGRLLDL